MDNVAIDDYVTLLPSGVFRVYCLYARRVMQDSQSTVMALRTIAKHLHIRQSKVSKSLKILEWLGMIHVNWQGKRHSPRVYLLELMPLNTDRIEAIRQRLEAVTGYDEEKRSLLKRLDSFCSLNDRITTDIAAIETPSEPIHLNGNGAPPSAVPLPEKPVESDAAWLEMQERIQTQIPKATFNNWVSQAIGKVEGNRLIVWAESASAKDWLNERLSHIILRVAKNVTGKELELEVLAPESQFKNPFREFRPEPERMI